MLVAECGALPEAAVSKAPMLAVDIGAFSLSCWQAKRNVQESKKERMRIEPLCGW